VRCLGFVDDLVTLLKQHARSLERRGAALSMLALIVGASLTIGCRGSRESGAGGSGLEVRRGLLVAHALGSIDDLSYTNSLEALRCNHKRGFRWFEVDLALTQDDELVAFHTGHERYAGFERPIDEVPYSDVQRARYRKRYAIVRFVDVLDEARALGDVVLVTDTKSWSTRMLSAVERVLRARPKGGPGIVLQSYGEKNIEPVAQLAKQVDAGVILTLYRTRVGDQAVVDMAKQYGVLAVVANQQRFTPWLADRLHAAQIPILVHTIDEHEEMVRLTRAGADGFYTDTYVPYERMTADPRSLLDCGAEQPSAVQLRSWLKRDLGNDGDYRLSACAKRRGETVELGGCDEEPAIGGPSLRVPPGGQIHVDLEVEAPARGTDFWFKVATKTGPEPRPREELHLEPGERRTFAWDLTLPDGSPGVETLLGVSSSDVQLRVLRLAITLTPPAATGEGSAPPAPPN
jgi:glycerophosphoryl diester phosphodiesterase